MSDMERFGTFVRELRESRGLTQEELGEKIGVSRPTITQLERGIRRQMPIGLVLAMANALDVAPGMLLGQLGVSPSDAAPQQVEWLTEQLDAHHIDLLVELGYALLRSQQALPQKGSPANGRRSR